MFLPKEASFKEAYISRISLKAKICTLSIGYQTVFQSDLLPCFRGSREVPEPVPPPETQNQVRQASK